MVFDTCADYPARRNRSQTALLWLPPVAQPCVLACIARGQVARAIRTRKTMKAVRIHQFGGPEVLQYEDVPDPKPRKDQVLVRVRACAMNHLDLWVRKGLPGIRLPHIPGSDVAGEIVEIGEYVKGFQVG